MLAEKSRAGHTEEVRALLNKHGAPLAEPEKYPGGVKVRPSFEMGVAN